MDFESLRADFESHPIQGYLHTGERLDVPLVSHIVDNLYVGGCVHGVDLGDYFTHVFSFYKWERYLCDPLETAHYEWTMYDSAVSPVDYDVLEVAVPKIVSALRGGGNVLVHCQAGINRSNLAATLALRDWKGMTSAEAIALLRERRTHLVLSNKLFERTLLRLDDFDESSGKGV